MHRCEKVASILNVYFRALSRWGENMRTGLCNERTLALGTVANLLRHGRRARREETAAKVFNSDLMDVDDFHFQLR